MSVDCFLNEWNLRHEKMKVKAKGKKILEKVGRKRNSKEMRKVARDYVDIDYFFWFTEFFFMLI